MITFPDSEIVKDGLQRYFDHYGFKNGGYNDKTFTIKFWGPLKLIFPNTKGRIEAVKLHDIHHMLTQFEANLRGEAEIGAWEIAGGLGKYYAGWWLNFGSVTYGIFLWPRRIYLAYIWGLQCENLYHHTLYKDYDEKLLTQTIGDLRSQLGINKKPNPGLKNTLSFVFAISMIGLLDLFQLGIVVGFVWLVVWLVR